MSSDSGSGSYGYATLGTALLTLIAASSVGICTGWLTYQYRRSSSSKSSIPKSTATADQYIQELQLDGHPEGGWYKRIWESRHLLSNNSSTPTTTASAIYYLLTHQSSISHFHRNMECDLLDVYVDGNVAVRFILITKEGEMKECILGTDINAGQKRHLVVPAGTWKSNELLIPSSSPSSSSSPAFALMCESVSPGFTWEQHSFLTLEQAYHLFPQHVTQITHLIKPQGMEEEKHVVRVQYSQAVPHQSHQHAIAEVSTTPPRPYVITEVYQCDQENAP